MDACGQGEEEEVGFRGSRGEKRSGGQYGERGRGRTDGGDEPEGTNKIGGEIKGRFGSEHHEQKQRFGVTLLLSQKRGSLTHPTTSSTASAPRPSVFARTISSALFGPSAERGIEIAPYCSAWSRRSCMLRVKSRQKEYSSERYTGLTSRRRRDCPSSPTRSRQ